MTSISGNNTINTCYQPDTNAAETSNADASAPSQVEAKAENPWGDASAFEAQAPHSANRILGTAPNSRVASKKGKADIDSAGGHSCPNEAEIGLQSQIRVAGPYMNPDIDTATLTKTAKSMADQVKKTYTLKSFFTAIDQSPSRAYSAR